MFRPKSLRQRQLFFLILPVALLLLTVGLAGFFYARTLLFDQWREASILKLQRAAHQVDMQFAQIKNWLLMYRDAVEQGYPLYVQRQVLEKLRTVQGVVDVQLIRLDGGPHPSVPPPESSEHVAGDRHGRGMGRWGGWKGRGASVIDVTPPRFDTILAHDTVSLVADLIEASGEKVGRLEVAIRFDSLVANVISSGWWQSYKAFLVDQGGTILTCTISKGRHQLGETNDPLEMETLKALKERSSGTVFGSGHPPAEVSGFYRLEEAPWSLVMMAPGREILAPVITFRNYYFAIGSAFIVLVSLLIRWVAGTTAIAIREVADAAQKVARGDTDVVLVTHRTDEVGQLVDSFNRMVGQLDEGMRLRQALDLAMEVQQSLLPAVPPQIPGLDIAGRSLYCQETGGDYYDFLHFAEWGPGQVLVAVGDVVGHGIGAALLMTTARALLRARLLKPSHLDQVTSDVNTLLCLDTAENASFITVFLLMLDTGRKRACWTRAGHDPAIVYDPVTDTFSQWIGDGMALGVDDAQSFQENQFDQWHPGLIILIGTDGIWETANPAGEMFRKDRLRSIMRENREGSAADIVQAVLNAIQDFRQEAVQLDDITLVVVKIIE
jgi:phosphoserine phosphatase RsbU/P